MILEVRSRKWKNRISSKLFEQDVCFVFKIKKDEIVFVKLI